MATVSRKVCRQINKFITEEELGEAEYREFEKELNRNHAPAWILNQVKKMAIDEANHAGINRGILRMLGCPRKT